MGPLPVLSSAVLTGSAQQSLMGKQWHMLERLIADAATAFAAQTLLLKKQKRHERPYASSNPILFGIFFSTILFQTSQSERGLAILDIVISQNITVGPIPDPSSNPPPQFWSYSALKLEDDGTSAYHDNLLKTITFYYVPRSRWTGNWINLPSPELKSPGRSWI